MSKEETIFDLVVIGSGAAGLTAAVVGAQQGLNVLVAEKAETFGGTTARSGGGAWIPNNPRMTPGGFPDSLEQATTYLRGVVGNYFDAAKVAAFLHNGPEMVRFLDANSEVRFDDWRTADYEPSYEGSAVGRSIGVTEFDGRRLGADLDLISPVLPQFTIFGGMQVGYVDVPNFAAVLRSPRAFLYTALKVVRYAYDRAVYGRPTRLVLGNALIAALLLTARQKGVTLWRSSPMKRLIADDGSVHGVVVDHDCKEVAITARCGVILAAGGYGGSDAMRRKYLPLADAGWSLQPASNTGDGLNAGEQAGGHVMVDNAANANWAPFSTMIDSHGQRSNFPHSVRDRSFPGFLMVDPQGKRFVNEGASYQTIGNVFIERKLRSAWLICSHAALRRYGMGHVKPRPLPFKPYIRNGYLKTAPSISELAIKLGLDPAALTATVDRFNRFAREGQDPDFHKGEDPYSAGQGDATHKPNPGVGPLDPGPFYAVQLFPSDLSTINGLETDAHARVLDDDGQPIAGLYAAGIDANSVFRGTYPGGGSSIGPAMTFGYIAAMHAAGTKGTRRPLV